MIEPRENSEFRRFHRLFPTYFIWILTFIVLAILLEKLFACSIDIAQILSHVFLVHNWFDRTLWGISPSFWSIAVEIQLYALLPVLLGIVKWLGWGKSLVLVAGTEVVLRLPWWWLFNLEINDYLLGANVLGVTFAYWFSWSIGAWIASRQFAGASQPLARIPLSLAVALALLCWYFKPLSDFSFTAASFATCVWMSKRLAATEVAFRNNVTPNAGQSRNVFLKVLALVGACSYSLYLLHQPLLSTFQSKFVSGLNIHTAAKMLIHLGALLPVLCVLAYASYRLIELPTARWGRKPKR